MALNAQQHAVLSTLLKVAQAKGATPRVQKALVEAGLTESNLRNLPYGDKDSLGVLQERTSIYGRAHALNPAASAGRFVDQAMAANTRGGSAGQLAQRVQRSAFPARYDQQGALAASLLGGAGRTSAPVARSASTSSSTVDTGPQRAALISQFLNSKNADPVTFALGIRGLNQQQAAVKAPTAPRVASRATSSSAPAGGNYKVASLDGKQVAAWMLPALQYARANGWKGTITSGVRSRALQAQLYQRYLAGGNIAAKPGQSNHEIQNGGAVDVSDPAGLAAALRGFTGRKPIQGTAIGDPVHWSANGR